MLVKDPGTRACLFVMLSSISGVGGWVLQKEKLGHSLPLLTVACKEQYTRLHSTVFPGVPLWWICFTWSGKVIKFYSRSHTGWPPFSNPGKNCGCISRSVSCSALPLPPWQMERGFMPPQGKWEGYPVTFWWSQIRRGAQSLPMSEGAIDTSIP